MAKIGILTFHRSYNYGAFMQCYGLSHRLKKDFPEHIVEVIDYATERVYRNYPTKLIPLIFGEKEARKSLKGILISLYFLLKNPKQLRQNGVLYECFCNELAFLPLSDRTVISDDYRGFFDKIKDQYDIIIVGSDGVWEYKTYPFPNAYFLNGNFENTHLMSFAASSDRMHPKDITDSSRSYIKEAFEKFDYIGIRDVATEKFVKSVSPKLILNHNCDPSMLLELDSLPKNLDRVKKDLKDHHIDISKPVICVMGNNKLCKRVREMFGKKYQIVSIYYYSKYADYYINNLSPIEWAQIFSLFSVTVTSFFHGSLLSLKNGCPTVATDYWYQIDEEHITKIHDLYKRLDLMKHYFFMSDVKTDKDFEEIKDRIEFFIQNPDKEAISKALNKESESYNSFKDALSEILLKISGPKEK